MIVLSYLENITLLVRIGKNVYFSSSQNSKLTEYNELKESKKIHIWAETKLGKLCKKHFGEL